MLRTATRIGGIFGLVLSGAAALWVYESRFSAAVQIAKLQQERAALQQVVSRLSDEKRVAELLVTEQKPDSSSESPLTTILFVEYTRGGQSLPPKTFTIQGKFAHLDAMVIKFDRHFVEEGDPLRGRSIALFTRIFGDQQSPADAELIDRPGTIPDVYKDADERVIHFEQTLWNDFWRLTSDENYRKEKGVRVAMGQGVWGMFEPGKLYTITLESDGGLNLTSEPLKGIYKEALKFSDGGK